MVPLHLPAEDLGSLSEQRDGETADRFRFRRRDPGLPTGSSKNLPHWGGLPAEETPVPDPVKRSPLNLILYGPPGTGKTYRTMAEAVRLCRGLADNDPLLTDPVRRQELRKAYEELRGQGQIGFVTFHQNYAYEEYEARSPTSC